MTAIEERFEFVGDIVHGDSNKVRGGCAVLEGLHDRCPLRRRLIGIPPGNLARRYGSRLHHRILFLLRSPGHTSLPGLEPPDPEITFVCPLSLSSMPTETARRNNQLLGTLHTVHSKRKMYEKRHTTRSMHKETSCHHKIQRRVRSTPTYHEYGVHTPRSAPASVTSPCGAFSAWTRAHLYYPSTQLASTETTEIFLLTFPSPSVRYDTCSVNTCISHAILP